MLKSLDKYIEIITTEREFMSKNKNLQDEIKSQHKKLKDMAFNEKVDYIWGYYKIHIIVTLIVILSIIAIIITYMRNNYDTVFTAVVIDGDMTGFSDHTDPLTTEFSKYIGIDGKRKRVIFDNNFTLIQTTGDQDSYYSTQKIATMAATHSVDGYFCEYNYVNFYSSDEELFLTDLTELLTTDEMNRISDYLVYFTAKDGTKIPVAVDLTSTRVKTETNLTMKRPCYGIVTGAPNQDNAVKFIKYAFGL